MKLESHQAVLTINDNIKSVEHFEQIKSKLDTMKTSFSAITLNIPDSLSITSSVIGYLMKLVHKENINISIRAGDERLIDLLDDLGLSNEFHVTKV